MSKAIEVLQRIKQAEETAQSLINDAKKKANELLREGELLATKKYEDIIQSGKKEVNSIREQGWSKGEREANTIIEEGNDEFKKIIGLDKQRIDQAVQVVIERIVDSNGNR